MGVIGPSENKDANQIEDKEKCLENMAVYNMSKPVVTIHTK